MICQNCKKRNKDEAIFCEFCGERLNKSKSDYSTVDGATNNDNKNKQAKKQGYLGRAIEDIKSTDKWLKKLSLAGLCNIIPILNFTTSGYALNWGVNAAKKEEKQLSDKLFENDSFKYGFFEFAIWLIYGIVFLIATQILHTTLGALIILGAVLGVIIVVAKICYNSFISLTCVYMRKENDFSAAFHIKNIWESFKKNFGKLILIYLLPALIFGLIALAISTIIFMIFLAGQINALVQIINGIQYILTSPQTFIYLVSLISSFAAWGITSFAIFSFLGGIEKVIRYRAVGYYLLDNSEAK